MAPFDRSPHFRYQNYVRQVTLIFAFDLETAAHYCHWVDNRPTNFDVSMTFRSRLIGQHLSDVSRNLATLTFVLEGHGALFLMRVFVIRLYTKFELRV